MKSVNVLRLRVPRPSSHQHRPLPAAAHVGHRVAEAAVQQAGREQAELRPRAGLVGPVAVQQARRGPVRAQPAAVGDGHRDHGAVGSGRGQPLGLVPGRVVARHVLPLAQLPRPAGQVNVMPPGGRVDERLGPHHHRGRRVLLVDRQLEGKMRAGSLMSRCAPVSRSSTRNWGDAACRFVTNR